MQKRNVLAGGEKKLIKVEENVGISRLLASFILKMFQLNMFLKLRPTPTCPSVYNLTIFQNESL